MTTYRIFRCGAPNFVETEVRNNSGFPVEPITMDDTMFIINLLQEKYPHDEFVIVRSDGMRARIMS